MREEYRRDRERLVLEDQGDQGDQEVQPQRQHSRPRWIRWPWPLPSCKASIPTVAAMALANWAGWATPALGEIGGSEAEVVLERCIIYEKKQDVRDAAAAALRHARSTPHPASSTPSSAGQPPVPEATIPPQQSEVPRLSNPLPSPGSRTSPFRPQPGPNEPSLEGPGSRPGSDSSSNWSASSGSGSCTGAASEAGSESATAADADRTPPPAPVPVKPQ